MEHNDLRDNRHISYILQFRLLHALWRSNNHPSRKLRKTALHMAMNTGYRSFIFALEIAKERGLVKSNDSRNGEWIYITDKGIRVHNLFQQLQYLYDQIELQ